MNLHDFTQALSTILECDPSEAGPDAVLKSLPNWDSLAVLSFIALAREKLGRTVAGQDVARCSTVRDLAALVGVA